MPRITQLASVLNGANGIIAQTTGSSVTATEDLSNIVDVGRSVLDFVSVSNENKEAYLRTLIDQVGKFMFVDRVYASKAPSLLMDSWEYGSVMEKVRCELPDTADNKTWDLFNYTGADWETNPSTGGSPTYPDPFIITKPSVKAKFFNSKSTYEIPITLTDVQLRSAFQTAEQFSSFISMIENRIRMKKTLCNDALIMATIDNLIALKMAKQSANVINLLALYNGASGTLTAAKALSDKDFLRFAAMTIAKYKEYIAYASSLYNESGAEKYVTFTPADRLKFIANTEFAKALGTYLYSDTYHEEFVKLDGYEEVAYWQATGTTGGSPDSRMNLNVKVLLDPDNDTKTQAICDGVVAVMFDRDAAGVCNQHDRVTSIWNPRGEYYNYFYKWDASYFNDDLENCVVFVIDDVYAQDNRVGAGSSVTTAPSNWTTLDDKLFYLDDGVMTAAAGTTYDKDVVYFIKNSDAPVDPT